MVPLPTIKETAMFLVLSRRKNENIVINNDITITVVEIREDKVRLGVISPKDIPVHRQEVFEAIHGKSAAVLPSPTTPEPKKGSEEPYHRFTDRARKVLQLANQEAQRFKHEYIGTEHILLGLVKEGTGVAVNVLKNLDTNPEKIRREVEQIVLAGPEMVTIGKLPQTPRAKKVIEFAIEEARNLNHNYVGTEHLLLGLLREQEGVAAQVLMNLGLKLEDVREEVLNLLGHGMDAGGESERGATSKGNKSKTPALDSFGRDLTDLARQGKLDPVIGRQNEIERVIQVLSRRTKNNPVLLGEAGVGKTAIVEGLARMIVDGNVPELLRDRRIVVLDLAMMVADRKST